jgi:hypothetical protein
MTLLLGPDGAPIQQVSPLVQAATVFFGKVGCSNMLVRSTRLMDNAPAVHIVQIFWSNQLGNVIQWETASGRTAIEAAHRMVERCLETGECMNCKRSAAISPDVETPWIQREFDPEDNFCLVSYDPETVAYRRACDGA